MMRYRGRTLLALVSLALVGGLRLQEPASADACGDKVVAVGVTSSRHLAVTRTIERVAANGSRLDGSTTLLVGAPARTWAFPEAHTGVTFQEYATFLNPTATEANVTILLAPQAISAAGARHLTLTVPPLSRVTPNIRALNLTSPAKPVAKLVSSDVPLVAERVIYFGEGVGSGKFGSTVSAGIGQGSRDLHIAIGRSGGAGRCWTDTAPCGR